MTRHNPITSKKEQTRHQRDAIPWRFGAMALVCGLLLIGGFFWAAKQHFSVIDLAIKNAKLRREKEVLESEQRRLYLTREIALSPAEIKKAARKIGLQDLTPENIEVMIPEKTQETLPAEPAAAFLKQSSTPIPIVESDDKTVAVATNQPIKTEAKNTVKTEPVAKKPETIKTETAKKTVAEKAEKKPAEKIEKKVETKKTDEKKVEKKADTAKAKPASTDAKRPQAVAKKQ